MNKEKRANIIHKLIATFWKQNSWHKHWVFIHTLKVTFYIIKNKKYKMITAGLLHDIWKPIVATVDNTKKLSYSFTWHEEKSYQIIKNIPFISDYSKNLIRRHYLIRWIKKANKKSMDQNRSIEERSFWKEEYRRQSEIYKDLDEDFKKDLSLFLKYDDLGK